MGADINERGMLGRIGPVCRDCRERTGASVQSIAVIAGVNPSTVYRFEHPRAGGSWPRNADRLVYAYAIAAGTEARLLWQRAVRRWGGER
jgi:hypothetical protein